MRKPSLYLVFLFLLGLGISEIPEQIRLSDDVSNDFVVTPCGSQSLQSGSLLGDVSPISGRGSVVAVPRRTFQDFGISSLVEPFHLAGQDRLVLCSIQRT